MFGGQGHLLDPVATSTSLMVLRACNAGVLPAASLPQPLGDPAAQDLAHHTLHLARRSVAGERCGRLASTTCKYADMPQNLSSCGGVVFSPTGCRPPVSLPGWQSKDKGKKWLHAIAIEAIPYMTKEALVEVTHTYHGRTPTMHCPGL